MKKKKGQQEAMMHNDIFEEKILKKRWGGWLFVHPVKQHAGHSLQAVRQGSKPLDGLAHGAEQDEQHLVHRLALLELPLELF